QEISGFEPNHREKFPRQPAQADSMAAVRRMFDGYDTGTRYADEHVGMLLEALAKQGVLDETVIIISSDHGENLGELNIYGDHQTADLITTRVPLIVKWPGVTTPGGSDTGLHYHFDFAATMIELLGQQVPGYWDGRSFAPALREGRLGTDSGREYLVVSQGAWSCQRGVRFRDEGREYFCLRSYHDGYHGFPDVMLFDVGEDPHEQVNLAESRPGVTARALAKLEAWQGEMMRTATHGQDPMWTVMREGGALHTRGELPRYLERLRATGRGHWADHLAAKHPKDC
ncbi:MAG: sulfatase-like hydrolase/transferase, partial [Phycisphaeraceae bacterium]|nr:sulfatase-like hydrolase/transferase [Phycisphaeraceae bacterium]